MTGKTSLLKGLIVTIFAGVSLFNQSLFAQVIDDSMLEILKSRVGGSGSSKSSRQVRSPLDQARQKEFEERQNLFREEREEEAFLPSRLEEDFQKRLETEITQYGYSIFDNIPNYDNVMTGSISDNYKLGIGDELIITFMGAQSDSFSVKVDLEGRVIIPEIRPISVIGMGYGEFKTILKKHVEESIIGTDVYVSLASVRMISVFVVGEVGRPGVIQTSSLANPLAVLMNAGGVKKTGSLRNITIYRDGKKTTFDIYALLSGQDTGFYTLNDGDRIIVPTIGATIALDGELIRPGIYELPAGKNNISYEAAMLLAGGTLRPSGYEMSQIKIDSQGTQTFRKIGRGEKIYNGEAIIARLVENFQAGKVELVGHVRTPGMRALSNANNIRGLLGNRLNLEDNPYLLFGLIERIEERTQTRYLETFSPENIFSGGEDIPLKDGDRVIFLGRSDITFLISDFVREVVVTGKYSVEAKLPDGKENLKFCMPLKNLARIINDTQSNRFATATRAVFVRKEVAEIVAEKSANLELQELPQTIMEQSFIVEKTKKEKAEEKKEEEESAEKERRLFCPNIFTQVNNLLPLILEYTVSVDGAVRLPGVYPVITDTSLASLLAVSGGTSNDANLTNIEIATLDNTSGSRSMQIKWDYVDATERDLTKIGINPGGGIRVGSKFSNFESGAVLLSGEFRQPGVYTIRKGEKLSDLISRAGGVTDQAYTYGAIFTRTRVKEIQRAELKKTARHLQSAMISASVKKNIGASSLMAAQQLTDKLVNAELIGRVVIEADPLKLSLNPSLDTVLEAGDALYIPKRPNFIIAMGDVLNPGALQFIPGKPIRKYIDEVGSYTRSADEGRVYIVYPNGVARPVSFSSWGGDRNISIPPGTAIVVPTNLSPLDTLTLVTEIGNIFRNLAVSAASIAVLVRD
ncbi:MAG: SLBB domain-containing protein [Emcibacter sp.]|nr:SLBB domain-containing protein [Emcibacter sp.]